MSPRLILCANKQGNLLPFERLDGMDRARVVYLCIAVSGLLLHFGYWDNSAVNMGVKEFATPSAPPPCHFGIKIMFDSRDVKTSKDEANTLTFLVFLKSSR